jgi:ribonucleoside-triphosphate reductase
MTPKTPERYRLEKRSGQIVLFNPDKITSVLKKGYDHYYTEDDSFNPPFNLINDFVLHKIRQTIKTHDINIPIYIEDIQDIVVKALLDIDPKLGQHYADYRNIRLKRRKTDPVKVIDKYIADHKSKMVTGDANSNANMVSSFAGLFMRVGADGMKQYYFDKILDQEQVRAHQNGEIHIHDLDMVNCYCAGWSLSDLLIKGMRGPNSSTCGPAKHFDTALSQMVNFIGTLQNEFSKHPWSLT